MPCLPSSSADRVSIPEDEGVDPLVAMPAPVRRLSQLLPLPAARHLLFEADHTGQNHLLRLGLLGELNRLLLNPFLLHDLPQLDRVSCHKLLSILNLLLLQLSLQAFHHFGIPSKIDLSVNMDGIPGHILFAFHNSCNRLLDELILQPRVVREVGREDTARLAQPIAEVDDHLRG